MLPRRICRYRQPASTSASSPPLGRSCRQGFQPPNRPCLVAKPTLRRSLSTFPSRRWRRIEKGMRRGAERRETEKGGGECWRRREWVRETSGGEAAGTLGQGEGGDERSVVAVLTQLHPRDSGGKDWTPLRYFLHPRPFLFRHAQRPNFYHFAVWWDNLPGPAHSSRRT